MESKHQRMKSKLTKRESSLMRKLFKLTAPPTLKQSKSTRNLFFEKTMIKNKLLSSLSPKRINDPPVKQISLSKNKKEYKESKLDFSFIKKKITNPLMKLCIRFVNCEKHLALSEQLFSITTIQSFFRGYLCRKSFFSSMQAMIEEKGRNEIILIQSYIRKFLTIKSIKRFILLKQVYQGIHSAIMKITHKMREFYYKNNGIKKMIFKDIVLSRIASVTKIQAIYRSKLYQRKFKDFMKTISENYYFNYPFYAKTVELKVISIGDGTENNFMLNIDIFPFEYNSILKTLILLIPPQKIKRGKHRCQFIVDGNAICDGRYPHVEFSDGLFYNLVDFVAKNQLHIFEEDNEYLETRPDDNIKDYSGSLSDKVFLNGVKNIKENDSYMDLRKDLFGKKPISLLDKIRKTSFSAIEGNSYNI